MTSNIVYSQRECAKCVELVLNGIERYKNDPRYANIKDEESLINWLMNDIINAIPFLIGLKENYLEIYGHKHMPPRERV